MSKRLYVGNLSAAVSVEDLERAFAAWGGSRANIPGDKWHRGRPFGFIDVADDQLEAALGAMHGTELGGRAIAVYEANYRDDHGGYGPARGGYYTSGTGGFGTGGAGGGGRW